MIGHKDENGNTVLFVSLDDCNKYDTEQQAKEAVWKLIEESFGSQYFACIMNTGKGKFSPIVLLDKSQEDFQNDFIDSGFYAIVQNH